MAINVEVLKTRALTAVVFVAVMLTGLLWNQWSFIALFTIIHFGCWYEFVKLMKKIHGEQYLMHCLLGLVYITMPILLMIGIYAQYTTPNLPYPAPEITLQYFDARVIPCGIIFSIWINDTMAYIVGSFIGKTPFSKISPKKTWEGTLGGAILCVLVIALLGFFIPVAKEIATRHWIAIAAICAIFGTAGDLLESKIKRMADVKDSGSIMPGHGGFLDRFDSLLVAVPFVWLYVILFIYTS
ncbi:phosphatidate cytidylyltransferase [Ferruginibacter paludis]|uniref:phosphatidate cytidylyltransferase n=1 Tax=Ferruginibacter paludis TaxID=1310417 RepID=UPI0025B42ED6|nr:phosphatidate cytidylyltransferase [Ferruginibacter paludis]MDN3658434.1 phosphatidate cytidylyltransferase [Ferruginibacter paludis]